MESPSCAFDRSLIKSGCESALRSPRRVKTNGLVWMSPVAGADKKGCSDPPHAKSPHREKCGAHAFINGPHLPNNRLRPHRRLTNSISPLACFWWPKSNAQTIRKKKRKRKKEEEVEVKFEVSFMQITSGVYGGDSPMTSHTAALSSTHFHSLPHTTTGRKSDFYVCEFSWSSRALRGTLVELSKQPWLVWRRKKKGKKANIKGETA